MFTKNYQRIFLAVLALIIITACEFLNPTATPDPASPDAVYTAVAQTVVAQMTQAANNTSPTPTLVTTIEEQPTAAPTITPLATYTTLPTWTPLPTNTLVPTPTAIPCNLAQFVSDVTYADGSAVKPGKTFVKTWRLKNIGSCTWTTSYNLLFISGDKMNASTLIPLTKTVAPGQTIDVSVELTAPEKSGSYLGNWQLRASDGTTFGIGVGGNKSFWVQIVVLDVDYTLPYSFVPTLCLATWTSGAGTLPCPGQSDDWKGFVQILTEPVLETGKKDDEPALWVHPQFTNDGYIQGEYPDFQVYPGDKFVSYVGCLYNYKNCKVIFTLSYRNENGTIKNLGTWAEAYEGLAVPVSIDLSSLAGMKVNFILRVDAWGNADGDSAFWLNPHIVGQPRLDATPFCPGCDN